MADIKAIITLTNKECILSGYRPTHVIGDYLTTGLHEYIGVDRVMKNQSVEGYITFISPEAYPNSLSNGTIIYFQEGSKIIGRAEVIEIYNEVLMKNE